MKQLASTLLALLVIFLMYGYTGSVSPVTSSDLKTVNMTGLIPVSSSGSTAGFTLGVQMWTFKNFSFTEALDKVDSSGIKNIEAFIDQNLGTGMEGKYGLDMSQETRSQIKQLLQKKGIHIVAMGVIVPKNKEEWIKTFELANWFGMQYITSEPIKSQWDMVDSLAGVYGIPVAIHDHPKPNMYWSPDSVLAAIQGHPHLGSCADIGHWARNGLNPVDCLKKLQGHIIGVHLKDIVVFNDTKAHDTVVSKGIIDIPAVFAELKRQNFKGMISIEHESNWSNNLPDVIFTRIYYDSLIKKLQ